MKEFETKICSQQTQLKFRASSKKGLKNSFFHTLHFVDEETETSNRGHLPRVTQQNKTSIRTTTYVSCVL